MEKTIRYLVSSFTVMCLKKPAQLSTIIYNQDNDHEDQLFMVYKIKTIKILD